MDGNSRRGINRIVLGVLFVLAFILSGLTIASVVSAQSNMPEGVEKYNPEIGWFCIRDVELGVHFCEPIDPCCNQDCSSPEPTLIPPTDPTPTPPTPVPTPPDPTPVPTSTPEPVPSPTPKPEKTKHPNCGPGNDSEGADPNENACGDTTGEENDG